MVVRVQRYTFYDLPLLLLALPAGLAAPGPVLGPFFFSRSRHSSKGSLLGWLAL